MIYRINGQVTEVVADGFVVNVGGVEYKLEASTRCIARHGRRGLEVSVLTFLYPREDSMFLFGFADREERELFHQLITVSGIGPKAALRILSGISPAEFGLAVGREDIDRLSAIPGLGRKTAQKLVLALAGKLVLDGGEKKQAGGTSTTGSGGGFLPDIEAALVDMGFDRRLASDALANVAASYLGELGLELDDPSAYYAELAADDKRRFEEEILLRAIRALA